MPTYVLPGNNIGLLVRGNIDIDARALVAVPVGNGQYASVRTVSFHLDGAYLGRRYHLQRAQGAEVLIPTVIRVGHKWAVVGYRAAFSHYLSTGRHLGIFDTPAHATSYGNRLHLEQAAAGAKAGR